MKDSFRIIFWKKFKLLCKTKQPVLNLIEILKMSACSSVGPAYRDREKLMDYKAPPCNFVN